jgi:hypothetical protein
MMLGCGSASIEFRGSDPPPAGGASISGTVVDDSTSQSVPGAIVLAEQPDAGGVDRIVSSATTSFDGSFSFDALPAGNYDLVASASIASGPGTTTTYAATVTFRVPTGTTLGSIPLVPEFGSSMPNGLPAAITAVVTTSGFGTPPPVDVKLSALQAATPAGGSAVPLTIPTFGGSTPEVTTAPGAACPAGTTCANYTLQVPSSAPVVGTFSPAGTSYTIPAPAPVEVIYRIEGRAFVAGSAGTADCVPSIVTVGPVVPRGTLVSVIPNLAFTGCQ